LLWKSPPLTVAGPFANKRPSVAGGGIGEELVSVSASAALIASAPPLPEVEVLLIKAPPVICRGAWLKTAPPSSVARLAVNATLFRVIAEPGAVRRPPPLLLRPPAAPSALPPCTRNPSIVATVPPLASRTTLWFSP